jgi:hypothetical protein
MEHQACHAVFNLLLHAATISEFEQLQARTCVYCYQSTVIYLCISAPQLHLNSLSHPIWSAYSSRPHRPQLILSQAAKYATQVFGTELQPAVRAGKVLNQA